MIEDMYWKAGMGEIDLNPILEELDKHEVLEAFEVPIDEKDSAGFEIRKLNENNVAIVRFILVNGGLYEFEVKVVDKSQQNNEYINQLKKTKNTLSELLKELTKQPIRSHYDKLAGDYLKMKYENAIKKIDEEIQKLSQ